MMGARQRKRILFLEKERKRVGEKNPEFETLVRKWCENRTEHKLR